MDAYCDEEDNQLNLIYGIVDHMTDGHVIAHADMYIKYVRNRQV
jgi:hypothetical protein